MGVTVKIYIQRPVVREGLGERHRAVSECEKVKRCTFLRNVGRLPNTHRSHGDRAIEGLPARSDGLEGHSTGPRRRYPTETASGAL